MNLVSILVPVYNVEKYLNRCIDSILNQTYKNFELILVDDCSEDNSLLICNEYAKKDNRIKVIKKPKHTILSDVRNVGIENASGEYLMFVDSDDYVCNDFVEKMVRAIEENNVDVVKCRGILHRKDDSYYLEPLFGNEGKTYRDEELKDLVPMFGTKIGYNTWSLIIKHSSLKVKFDKDTYCAQDKVFIIDLILSISSIYFLDEALYHYCSNSEGTTNSYNNYLNYVDGILIAHEKIKTTVLKNDLLTIKIEEELNASCLISIFFKTYRIMNYKFLKVYDYIKKAFETEKFRNILGKVDVSKFRARQRIKYILVKHKLYLLCTIFLKIDYKYAKFRKFI